MLAIVPRRRQQRNAAGERLEHADRRNAGQNLRVETARHMDRCKVVGEHFRSRRIGQPTVVARAKLLHLLLRSIGIANAMDVERQMRVLRRFQQIVDKLRAALAVTPVADPDQALAVVLRHRWMKAPNVGGFVPDEHAIAPAPAVVNVGERRSERQNPVIGIKIVGAHLVGSGDCAVVGIVEQQSETTAARAQPPECRDQFRIIPFVDDDEVRAPSLRRAFFRAAVGAGAEFRISGSEGAQPLFAMVLEKIGKAPRTFGLEHTNVVPARNKVAENAAQEMRIPVVPARAQRMGEIDDPHAAPAILSGSDADVARRA